MSVALRVWRSELRGTIVYYLNDGAENSRGAKGTEVVGSNKSHITVTFWQKWFNEKKGIQGRHEA